MKVLNTFKIFVDFFLVDCLQNIYLLSFERHCCQENKTSYYLAVLWIPAYREGDLVLPTWSQGNENLNTVGS